MQQARHLAIGELKEHGRPFYLKNTRNANLSGWAMWIAQNAAYITVTTFQHANLILLVDKYGSEWDCYTDAVD